MGAKDKRDERLNEEKLMSYLNNLSAFLNANKDIKFK